MFPKLILPIKFFSNISFDFCWFPNFQISRFPDFQTEPRSGVGCGPRWPGPGLWAGLGLGLWAGRGQSEHLERKQSICVPCSEKI